ncbi:MAG: hypothetical protein HY779_05415 [Rubrobacteridae bacterium]|nr:hypothetical protein [Rubrobacteridae bacterium]
MDNLNRKNKSHKAGLTVEEKNQLKSLLTRIVDLSAANERLLTDAKEMLVSELRTTQLKKKARGFYEGQLSGVSVTRSVG